MGGFVSGNNFEYVEGVVNDGLSTVMGWAADADELARTVLGNLKEVSDITVELGTQPSISIDGPVKSATDLPVEATLSAALARHTYPGSVGNVAFVPPVAPKGVAYETIHRASQLPSNETPEPVPQPIYGAIPATTEAFATDRPVAPSLSVPDDPALLDIAVLSPTVALIAPFAYDLPDIDLPDGVASVEAVITKYAPDAIFTQKLNDAVVLGTGLPAEIEHMAFAKLADKIAKEEVVAVSGAAEGWAARNFSLVPGGMVKDVMGVQSESYEKKGEALAQVRDGMAKVALDNARASIKLGIQLERGIMGVTVERGRQLVEAEKIRVASAVARHNALIAAFNEQAEWFNTVVAVYGEHYGLIDAVAAANDSAMDTVTARVGQQKTLSGIHESKVRVVEAVAKTNMTTAGMLSADADVYRAKIGEVKAQLSVAASNVALHEKAIRAYSERVKVQSAKFGALSEQAQTVASEGQVIEANAQAYAAFVRSAAKTPDVVANFLAEQNRVIQADMDSLRGSVSAIKSYNDALIHRTTQEAGMTETVARMTRDTQGVLADYYRAKATYDSAQQNVLLSKSEHAFTADMLAAQANIEVNNINSSILAAKAQLTAGYASGAMNALHVGAHAAANAQQSENGGFSLNASANRSYRESHTYSTGS